MRSLVPSRLVVVRSYGPSAAGTRGGSWVFGGDDRKLLLEAGIEAHVKSVQGFGLALMVPESRAAEARQVLAASPNLFPDETVPPCPKCHAPHPSQRPPYGLGIVAVGFAIAAVSIVKGYAGVSLAALAAGVIGAAILETRLAPWRCVSCGYHYGLRSDPHKVVRMPPRN